MLVWLLHLVGDKAAHVAINIIEIDDFEISTLETVDSYPSLSWSIEFLIQEGTMDAARLGPQGPHYYASVITLLPLSGVKLGTMSLWYSVLGLHQFDSRHTTRRAVFPYILYQVCGNRGVQSLLKKGGAMPGRKCTLPPRYPVSASAGNLDGKQTR